MKTSLIAPELRGPVRRVPSIPLNALGIRVMRGLISLVRAPKLDNEVAVAVQAAGDVPLRVYTPAERRSPGALLWFHGGGLILGNALQDELHCAQTAREHGILVVSVEYRLAPEHPFPAAIDDCSTAWGWLQSQTDALGVDPARIVVGGQSAGGGLAAALAQRLRDGAGPQPLAQWLFCPMLDDRTAMNRELDAIRHPVCSNANMRRSWKAYLGADFGAATVPDYAVAARRDDVTGLPPAWIGIGDIELFFDEAVDYTKRLRRAGVEVELDIVPGALHAFESWARNTQLARDYLQRSNRWLGEQLAMATPEDPTSRG